MLATLANKDLNEMDVTKSLVMFSLRALGGTRSISTVTYPCIFVKLF